MQSSRVRTQAHALSSPTLTIDVSTGEPPPRWSWLWSGNIYADESLWRTPLHYARNTRHLRTHEIESLLGHIGEVMTEALAQGGTSFDALYVNVNGNSGYFDRSLAAYGQEDEPCQRCGSPIRRDAFMNRSSFWCPSCQPRPRNGRF